MSPGSKSKLKSKSATKAGKEQSKISMKPPTMRSSTSHGFSVSAHNPVIETFHTLETSSSSFSSSQSNVQLRTIDDPDDHSTSSQGTTAEYESSSNNSCSGESDDMKEKPIVSLSQAETILVCDNDKRDKIRLKNEKKHQRQKEKRAQELHERCTAFLTSRKLEALSHQLVAMGFPADRATMAVIINKGRMEECVAWLLHERDDNKQPVSVNLEDKSCVTIDINDELARIAKMEAKYKCSRQDVERAVVTCEGDLSKAEENLKVQKQSTVAPNESSDSMKSNHKEAAPNSSPALIKIHPVKATPVISITQPRQEGRYSNLSKSVPKPTDWTRNPSLPVDKRWLTTNTPLPMASPVQSSVPPAKREAPAPKEPFVVMQRPKDIMNGDVSHKHAGMGSNIPTLRQVYPQNSLQTMPSSSQVLSASARWSNPWRSASETNSPPLTTLSPPGLLHSRSLSASSESSYQNGWNSRGSTPHRDYTSIDWSLDLMPLRPSMKIDALSDTWSTMFMGGNAAPPPPLAAASPVNGRGGIYFSGEVDGVRADLSSSGSLLEWSSPFEGRDLFRVPRKYVTSPSM